MFCNKCGKQVADTAKFCNYCGAVLPVAKVATAPKEVIQPKPSPTSVQPQPTPISPLSIPGQSRQASVPPQPKKKKNWIRIALILLSVLLVVAGLRGRRLLLSKES